MALGAGALTIPAWLSSAQLTHDFSVIVADLGRVPFPLGAIPVGIVVGLLVYLGFERFRGWTLKGRAPYTPTNGDGSELPERRPLLPLWIGGTDDEGVTAEELERSARPAAVEPARPTATGATIWSPRGGERPMAVPAASPTVAGRPPPRTAFAPRLVGLFLALAIALVVIHRYIFLPLDKIVQAVGTVAFWPLPWPGLILNPSLKRLIPDFIFLVYLAFITAFCIASELFTQPRFSPAQRRTAVLILVSYVLTEITIDMLAFILPGAIVASAFLLVRGLVGGFYFALLLFSTVTLPPPVRVDRRLPKDGRAVAAFFGTGLAAVVLSVLILFVLYRDTGLGRDAIPFAILLLLPLVGLTVWGVLGRILYEIQLVGRPLPSLEEYHPPVSLIIPAYNEEKNLAQAIASADAAAALYQGTTEIIVANDGSVDRTSSVARTAVGALEHAQGVVLDLPHGGKSNALNGALTAASGDIVVRIDADSRVSTRLGFGPMVSHLADAEVGGVQGLILPLKLDRWTGKLRLMEIAWNHLFLRRATMATRSTQVVDGAFCAFRRKDLEAAGGWVPWNGEDTELTLRLQRVGYRMRFEPNAAAFEDVPEDLEGLRKQRIRWNRGGLFAHRRHMPALFGEAFEFGGLAIILWFTFFARNGLRGLVWAYAALITLLVGLPTLYHVAVIAALLLVPRGIVIGYYLVKFGRWRYLPYIATWPVTGSIKQYVALESFGTMLPGSMPEFSE